MAFLRVWWGRAWHQPRRVAVEVELRQGCEGEIHQCLMAGVDHIALEVVDPGPEVLLEDPTAGTMLRCGVNAAFAEPDGALANGGTFTSRNVYGLPSYFAASQPVWVRAARNLNDARSVLSSCRRPLGA